MAYKDFSAKRFCGTKCVVRVITVRLVSEEKLIEREAHLESRPIVIKTHAKSQKEALEMGVKTYFDGRLCKRGLHAGEKLAKDNRCIECKRKYQRINARRYRRENPEASNLNSKAYRLRKMGVLNIPKTCEVCCKSPERSLHRDHCHDTGKFRGWICSNCNTAIGLIKDSPEVAESIATYLRRAA